MRRVATIKLFQLPAFHLSNYTFNRCPFIIIIIIILAALPIVSPYGNVNKVFCEKLTRSKVSAKL